MARNRLLIAALFVTLLAVGVSPDVSQAAPPPPPTVRVASGIGTILSAPLDVSQLSDGETDSATDAQLVPDPAADVVEAAKRRWAGVSGAAAPSKPAGHVTRLEAMTGAPSGPADGGLIGVWDGFPYTGWLPASPQIAAGPDALVATVNSRLRVFDKDGALTSSGSLRSWFNPVLAPLGESGIFVTEPWVLYDAAAGRFVLTAVASRADGLSLFLLAVSNDARPNGKWCLFGSNASANGVTLTQTFASTPRTGVNADAVLLTANMFSSVDGKFAYAKARFFPKSLVYDTACPSQITWDDAWDLHNADASPVWDLRPVLGDGIDHTAYFVNGRIDQSATLSLWHVRTEPGSRPLGAQARSLDLGTVLVTPFSIAPDAEQPHSPILVSTGSASLHAAIQRGRRLWTAHTVACTWLGDDTLRACARWYELDLDTGLVRQSGTFGQPGTYLFDPEVMPDTAGNAVIAFNRASHQVPVSSAYACRRTFAPLGVTDSHLVTLVDGQGCYVRLGGTDYNRWGLHNGISLDPTTGRTWIHSAYAYGASTDCTANAWRTALADVSCATIAGPTATRPGDPSPTPVPTQQPVDTGPSAPTPRPTLAAACRTAVDVMLVLDSSGSIGPDNYEVVRAFARAFVASLGVGPDGAHVGIVQFSSPGQNRLEIGLTGDLALLNDTVRDMRWLDGSTDMDDGLQIGLDELKAHARPGLPQVMVLVSDGQPNQGDPAPVAAAAKAAGVRLLTIGVGAGIDADLMRSLASAPADANFFFAEEFDALMELVDQLVVNLCPSPPPPTPVPTATPNVRLLHRIYLPIVVIDPACPPPDTDFIDVALVLDASTSMLVPSDDGRPKYEVALDAARRFSAGLRLRPGGDQLAVIAFNAKVQLLQPLTSDRDRLDAVLHTFTPILPASHLELGVQRATDELTSSHHRAGRRTAMVVLSDGKTNPSHGDLSILAAAEARRQGITVYVVGMGPDMDLATLEPMASGPTRFFPAANDAELAPIFTELVSTVSCPPEIYWPYRH